MRYIYNKKVRVIDDCLARLKVIHQRCEDDYQHVPRPDNDQLHDAYFRQVQWLMDEVLECLRTAQCEARSHEPVELAPDVAAQKVQSPACNQQNGRRAQLGGAGHLTLPARRPVGTVFVPAGRLPPGRAEYNLSA